MPTCYGRSGDMELLGAEMFVLTPWTAGRIVEFRPILEAKAATVAGWRVNVQTSGSGNRTGDVFEVIDDDLLGHDEVPGEVVQRPLSLPKHGHNFLTPRQLHRQLSRLQQTHEMLLLRHCERPKGAWQSDPQGRCEPQAKQSYLSEPSNGIASSPSLRSGSSQ